MLPVSHFSRIPTFSSCLFLFAALIYPVLSQPYPTHVVNTRSGKISGIVKRINGVDIVHFLGIPYAEPPVGKLRFAKPTEVRPWTGIRSATKLSPTCWQYLPTAADMGNPAAAMWLNNTEMSEDCLYLNVWAPLSTLKGRRPKTALLVWIFGGGYVTGTANIEIYNGAYMAATNDIVVASMQYRLGPFGFLHLQTDPSVVGASEIGNAALWDQNMAMSWIHTNARSFGAEKNRITLMGESAGAASVSMHLMSPYSQRLFARAILHSGSFLGPWSIVSSELAHQRTVTLASVVGCVPSSKLEEYLVPGWKYTQVLLKCLQGLDATTLVDKMFEATKGESQRRQSTIRRFFDWNRQRIGTPFQILSAFAFAPVKETGGFFPLSPEKAFSYKTLKKAPLLLGTNQDEGTYFLFYYLPDITNYIARSKSYVDVKLDGVMKKDPADFLVNYILPFNYLYPEVVDEVALMYGLPTQRLYPTKYQSKNRTEWIDGLDDIMGDLNFKCCVLTLGNWYASMKQPVYVYNFEHRTKAVTFPDWTGVMHGYELEYTFGMPYSNHFRDKFYSFTQGEKDLSETMMRYWSNFIKTGNPNKQSIHSTSGLSSMKNWPIFNNTHQALLRFTASSSKSIVTPGINTRTQQCKLWMKVVPSLSAKLDKLTSCARTGINGATGTQSSILTILISCFVIWKTLDLSWRTSHGSAKRPYT